MKKLCTLLIVLSLLCTALALTAGAAGEGQQTYYAGDTVTVTYYVPGAFGDISAGSIEFSHDTNTFELVEAKWELDNLFIKDVNLESRRGVFAFKTPKSVMDKIFTATYLVREDAVAGVYEFTANLQLQDNQGYNTPLDLTETIEIVERNENDEYTVELFAQKVRAIDTADLKGAHYAINEALAVYNALTDEEKQLAQSDYEILCKSINAYNDQANEHNQVVRSVTSIAFATFNGAFSFLSELVTLIVRTIFNK